MEQEENHEKGPRWSWARIQTGNVNCMRPIVILLVTGVLFYGCDKINEVGKARNGATNLAVIAWSPFLPAPKTYNHPRHLAELNQKASLLLATNKSLFGQHSGRLASDSPLRWLFGIPPEVPASFSWWLSSIPEMGIHVMSAKTGQLLGDVRIDPGTGLIKSTHDVSSLFVLSEIKRRLWQVVPNREEALRLFHGPFGGGQLSPEQQRAKRALLEALFLPPDLDVSIQMSAPGGTNGGVGYLNILFFSLSDNKSPYLIMITFPRPDFELGGVRFTAQWVHLNTQGFLLDTEGFPYPKPP